MSQRNIDDDLKHIEDLWTKCRSVASEACILWVAPEAVPQNQRPGASIELRPHIVDYPSLLSGKP